MDFNPGMSSDNPDLVWRNAGKGKVLSYIRRHTAEPQRAEPQSEAAIQHRLRFQTSVCGPDSFHLTTVSQCHVSCPSPSG